MDIHIIDLIIFLGYLVFMLGVGVYFLNKNKSQEDYYVGGRNMSAGHIGLSVVATDVGGGFSIGLGGLGFLMGLSGSWMLFTGLLGAWISAVFLIPKIYPIAKKHQFLTFPESLAFHYNKKVALMAGIISLIGYIGFTSSQILAGAKLASATFPSISITKAVLIMGIIAVVYTVIGGIKAVIYTDTIQWIILMVGLVGIGIPMGYIEIGGWNAIKEAVPASFLTLNNVKFIDLFNWIITIVPIWFVGMTLYQRIYACKDEQTAKKAWKIAGFFEYPIMAFMGVALGLFSRVAYEQGMFASIGYSPDSVLLDAELGLPLLLRTILPVGLMGLMMSAYFSAIMSTADSCLMAASGNLTTDIFGYFKKTISIKNTQVITFLIGGVAILIATVMHNVLELMLYSYAFMVSGLLIPVLGSLLLKNPSSKAALYSMITGGSTTLILILTEIELPLGLDANFFGITAALIVFSFFQKVDKK
ncbi:SSS family solute:Na+ symporter [Tenacibaculum maritimum]|uniref:sodium:solute symporter family protein n=1 Tax=Tenacibaculum maritimum TaxID=107401 RepID=UPI0012E5AD22|nr:sodium:solute symporter family protein [Tenacibaculum maritimum]CAA0151035.1 Solute:Na+ symporter, SSS family [Tenacibaculum maritimum]CAA0185522.1 SSS family solute:Na+ symporter [Tenacibaculum maritimum]CAA0243232.1 SSS family solute:Na+ symporter [Tenacibaculum maritimum]CAA0256162.1 Solute:Na+ symporter, SSS family [Tenacibaculum maritimum]